MTFYIVVIKNVTLTKEDKVKKSYSSLQLTIFDKTKYVEDNGKTEEDIDAPMLVIIIAASIGGVLTSICMGVLIYICIKTIKHKGLSGLQIPPTDKPSMEFNHFN